MGWAREDLTMAAPSAALQDLAEIRWPVGARERPGVRRSAPLLPTFNFLSTTTRSCLSTRADENVSGAALVAR
jgi:hypothetical protein